MEAKLFLLIGVMVGRAFAAPELDTVEIGTAGNQSTTNSATFEDDFTGVQEKEFYQNKNVDFIEISLYSLVYSMRLLIFVCVSMVNFQLTAGSRAD